MAPLWGKSASSATNKPKFLLDNEDAKYNRNNAYATASGWVMRAGTAAVGNDNASADPEILVAIGGLATTVSSATVTDMRFIIGTTATSDLTASGGGANARIEVEITWDEAVTVTGTPQLVVDNGNQSGAGYGDHTLNYSATGSTANRKRFVGTSKDLGVGDILTIGGTNVALNSGTIKDTADGTTVSSLVLSGLTAVTHTVLA